MRRSGAGRAGLRPVEQRTGMAPVGRHHTEAAVAGFSQVVSMASIGGHLARRSGFVRLRGAQLSTLGLVGPDVQVEGVVLAVCSVREVRL